jgi:integrase
MTKIRLPYTHEFVDRHGRVRRYFRRHDKRIPLPGAPGSVEFMEAYQAALAEIPRREIGTSRTRPDTINALVVRYYGSAGFQILAPITRSTYRNIIEKFRAEHGDKRVAKLERDHVRRLIDAKAGTPAAANNLLSMIGLLMRYAVEIGWCANDPTIGVRKVRVTSTGFHSWTEEEIALYEAKHPVGSKARLAFDLLLYTAQRRSDVVKMGRQHVAGSVIRIRQQKTGASLELPVHAKLAASLAVARRDNLTFLVTEYNKPFTAAGFGNKFREWCDEAGLSQECAAHGLRKAAARRLAEAGCTVHEIMAITGHKTLAEVERYTREAAQQRLAVAGFVKLAEVGK